MEATPETVYESDDLLIRCFEPDADKAVTAFDFRQIRDGNFADLKPSQKVSEAGQSYITVATKKNDWFLSPSLEDCHTHVSKFVSRFSRVVGFGSSMGAYGALALSRAFRFNQVLLVSPQATPFPDRPPFDDRFAGFAKWLDPKFDTLLAKPRKGLRGVMVFDPFESGDRAHVRLLQQAFPKLKTRALPFSGHPALKPFQSEEKLWVIQAELVSPNISADRLLAEYKALRHVSTLYRETRQNYLGKRA